jgi:hypothetical protein
VDREAAAAATVSNHRKKEKHMSMATLKTGVRPGAALKTGVRPDAAAVVSGLWPTAGALKAGVRPDAD